jgi:hypothetical protein
MKIENKELKKVLITVCTICLVAIISNVYNDYAYIKMNMKPHVMNSYECNAIRLISIMPKVEEMMSQEDMIKFTVDKIMGNTNLDGYKSLLYTHALTSLFEECK